MTPPESARSKGAADQSVDPLLTRFQSARSPTVRGPAFWEVVDNLIAAGRHTWALTLLEERGEDVDSIKAIFRRVDALLSQGGQGRQRAALDVLREAEGRGVVDLASIVDHLLAAGALALAAQVLEPRLGSPLAASLAAEISAAARARCRGGSLQASPFGFADAVRALQILSPDDATISGHVRRAATVLAAQLGEASRREDFNRATELLIRLARLAPGDLELLERLADAAGKAGRPARQLDTLMRIHALRGDIESLRRAVGAALAQSRWAILAQILGPPAEAADAADGLPEDIRKLAVERLQSLLQVEDIESALRLAAAVNGRMGPEGWPRPLIERLLTASRRQLSVAVSDPIAATRLLRLHLTLAPDDITAARILARLQMRLRRLPESRALLEDILRRDPHLAEDWRDLALIRWEAGDVAGADECTVRAWLIEPAAEHGDAYRDAIERLAPA